PAMTTATAAVLYQVKQPLVIEEVELLDPRPGEVQVRWVANGVCHSDYHLMSGDSPHPLPVVLGHEAAGVVERVGAGVTSVKPGDHVCSSYIPSCGKCGYCINTCRWPASRRTPCSPSPASFRSARTRRSTSCAWSAAPCWPVPARCSTAPR